MVVLQLGFGFAAVERQPPVEPADRFAEARRDRLDSEIVGRDVRYIRQREINHFSTLKGSRNQ
jgi:hypothetical protein